MAITVAVGSNLVKIGTSNLNAALDLSFTFDTVTATVGSTAYFGGTLTDSTSGSAQTEDFLLPFVVPAGGLTSPVEIGYNPTKTLVGAITGSAGKLLYK